MQHRLLVVDDEHHIADRIANVASRFGFASRAVKDPLLALEAFLEFKPHVAMIDMIMPEWDGIDVLHNILMCGGAPKIAIMADAVGAYRHLANDLARFHHQAPVEVLRKPIRRIDLVGFFGRLSGDVDHPVMPHPPASRFEAVCRKVQ